MKIHKEGKGSLIVSGLLFLIISIIGLYFLNKLAAFILAFIFLCLFIFVLNFFRNPARISKSNDINDIVAPVDGKVVQIKKVFENEYLKKECIIVSIFMSPLNVHVCRYPISGDITYTKYHKGKYLVAWHEKSSELNERNSVAVKSPSGTEVLFKQIAGIVARRIVSYANVGNEATAGKEFGFIKFGSRLDVFLPLNTDILVELNQTVVASENLIARLTN